MVIISCRFWHKMQQIWHKILKKVHRTFLSYAWQQKYPEHYNTLGKRIFNSNQFCCTPNTTEPSYFSTALRILFNPKPWFLLSFFCCCNQILFIFGNFCFTIILYLDEHKSFLKGYCQMDQSFFRIWNQNLHVQSSLSKAFSKYRTL